MKSSHSAHRAQLNVNNAPVPVLLFLSGNNGLLGSNHIEG